MAPARRRVERAEIAVDLGRGALDEAERADELDRHALGADAEIVQRALGLRAPEAVGRDLDRPEGVALGAGFAGLRGLAMAMSRAAGAAALFLAEAVEPHDFGAACGLVGLGLGGGLGGAGRRWTGARCLGSARLLRRPVGRLVLDASRRVGGRSLSSASSPTSSNCRPNCTDGSKKPLIASNGTSSFSGTPPNDRPTSKAVVGHRQIPELVLQDDGHLFRDIARAAARTGARPRRVVSKVM